MRTFFLAISFITLTYFSFGFYLATFDNKIFSKLEKQSHSLYSDYRGVTHVVTSFSKGSADPFKVLLEAAEAQLDFLFFTDLNLTDRPYSIDGYQGNVFTFSNQKMSYIDSHILIYSPEKNFLFDSLSSANAQLNQHFSEDSITKKKFLAVLAHPFKINHQWSGEYPVGLDGIEVINMRHLWQKTWLENKATFFLSVLTYPFNPRIALLRLINEPVKELELWDFLNKRKPTLGFLGNETTAKIFNFLGINFTFPSYKKSFNFASNHILLPSELTGYVESDREKIFNAIARGHFYFAFDSIGPTEGFAAYIKHNKDRFLFGSQIPLSKNLQLHIDLPKHLNVPYKAEIYKDGKLYFVTSELTKPIEIEEAGRYRIIIKVQPNLPFPDSKRWFGWIYTNPFYILAQ